MKIIIVDDEMSALHTFLSDVIHRSDIEYKFFKDDEREILDYAGRNNIAAAFLDIRMPKIDGIALARELIAALPAIRIVFITALDFTKDDLDEDVASHVMAFLYKPYEASSLELILSSLGKDAPTMTANMFGAFDCFINDMAVRFSSGKSKELFALLLTYNGKILEMSDAISQLWPDMNLDKAKPLYRDAVWRLRKTLKAAGFECVTFERARLILNKQNITCDYWDYLDGAISRPSEIFLKSYDWAENYICI